MLQFHNSFKTIPQLAGLKEGEEPASLKGYEVEPLDNSETMVNLQEYALASSLFYAMLETAACETSQRVMAMDNATTNAKDMVHGLSLIYNRARQAKITTCVWFLGAARSAQMAAAARSSTPPSLAPPFSRRELTEIISGSESLVSNAVSD